MDKRPDFIRLFIDSVRVDYDTGGLKRITPYILFCCLGIGALISYVLPENINLGTLFPLIAAFITAQGIILAMSMQTSGVILSNISQNDFCRFLKAHGLLDYYMLIVQFVQILHVTSLFLLISTAVAIMLDSVLVPSVFRIVFSLSTGFFLYSLRWTLGISVVVRDLLHYRSEYLFHEELRDIGASKP
jgi:hypothetical protein